jgi:integrase
MMELENYYRWIDNSDYSKTTAIQYKRMAKNLKKMGAELTQDVVDKYFTFYKLSPLNISAIKCVMEYLKLNPYNFRFPRKKGSEKKRELKFFEWATIEYINKNLPAKYSLVTTILSETGLRRFELDNIKVEDVDLINQKIHGIGKRNKEYTVFISKDTANRLKDLVDKKKQGYLFRYQGVEDSKIKLYRELIKEGNKIGIKKLTPHKIRHSLGRHLRVDLGYDLEEVREVLRHESVTTTQIYSRATKEEIQARRRKDLE